jgi:hypothetical protein
MVFTGVIFVISLCRIHSLMNILPDKEKADFKAMLIHSSAFGLFMVSAFLISITLTFYDILPTSNEWAILYNASFFLYTFLGFIS